MPSGSQTVTLSQFPTIFNSVCPVRAVFPASERERVCVSRKCERDRYNHHTPSLASLHPALSTQLLASMASASLLLASSYGSKLPASYCRKYTYCGSLLTCLGVATLLDQDAAANITPPVADADAWSSDKTPSHQTSSQLAENTYFQNPRNSFFVFLFSFCLCFFKSLYPACLFLSLCFFVFS